MITQFHWGLYTENKENPRKRGDLEGFDGLSQLIDGEKISLYVKIAGYECIIGSQFNYLIQGKGSRSNRYVFIEKFEGIDEKIDTKAIILTFFRHLHESLHPDENIVGFGNSVSNWSELNALLDSEIPTIETSLTQYIFGKLLLKLPVHVISHNPEFFHSTEENRTNSPSSDIVKNIILFINVMDSIGTLLRKGFLFIVCDNFKKKLPDFDLMVHPGVNQVMDYNQKKFFGEPLIFDLNLSEEKLLVHDDTVKTALKVVDLYRSSNLSYSETSARDRLGKSLRRLYISRYPDDLTNKNIMESEIGYALGLEYILLATEKQVRPDESSIRRIYSQMHIGDNSSVIVVLAQEHLLCTEVVRDALPIIILRNNFDLLKKITTYSVTRIEDKKKISAELSEIFEKIDWKDANDKTFNNGVNILKRALDEGIYTHNPIAREIVQILYRYLTQIQDITKYINKQELQKLETIIGVKKPLPKHLIIILIIAAACIAVGILYYILIFLPGTVEPIANITNNSSGTEILQSTDVQLPMLDPNNQLNFTNSSELKNSTLLLTELPEGLIQLNTTNNSMGT